MTDRELDALVAEKVMGWKLFESEPGYGRPPEHWSKPSLILAVIPHYSTDIAAAWEVVEHLRKRGVWLEELSGRYQSSYRAGFMWAEEHPMGTIYVQEMADTAARAICLAALKARGVEVEP